jgi:hypothetical protein
MDSREKPYMDRHKEIMNDWYYDDSCMLTTLPLWNLKNFKHFIFVAQSIHKVVM